MIQTCALLGLMERQTLEQKIAAGEIDTVVAAFPDLYGRLVGKRFSGRFFLDQVGGHGTHVCNYLFTVNLEMDPLDGFKLANWESGFGDFELRPDFSTLRIIPWLEGTALVLCNVFDQSEEPVGEAPREILRGQVSRLVEKNLKSAIAGELEFYLYNESFEEAWAKEYRNLKPASDYRIDYHILQPGRDEAFYRQVRNQLTAADIPIESSKGEWGRGQHEVNFIYGDPILSADRHVLFKHAIKEISAQRHQAVSFMPKISVEEPGNSCHIHISLWDGERNAFWRYDGSAASDTFRQFLGGLLKYTGDLSYFSLLRLIPINATNPRVGRPPSWPGQSTIVRWGFASSGAGIPIALKTACRVLTPTPISPTLPPLRQDWPVSRRAWTAATSIAARL